MTGKVTWNDIHEGTQKELKKTYNLSAKQLELQVRRHLYGANATQRRALYEKLYGKREK